MSPAWQGVSDSPWWAANPGEIAALHFDTHINTVLNLLPEMPPALADLCKLAFRKEMEALLIVSVYDNWCFFQKQNHRCGKQLFKMFTKTMILCHYPRVNTLKYTRYWQTGTDITTAPKQVLLPQPKPPWREIQAARTHLHWEVQPQGDVLLLWLISPQWNSFAIPSWLPALLQVMWMMPRPCVLGCGWCHTTICCGWATGRAGTRQHWSWSVFLDLFYTSFHLPCTHVSYGVCSLA